MTWDVTKPDQPLHFMTQSGGPAYLSWQYTGTGAPLVASLNPCSTAFIRRPASALRKGAADVAAAGHDTFLDLEQLWVKSTTPEDWNAENWTTKFEPRLADAIGGEGARFLPS